MLSATNRSIILMGDSMNTQLYSAMLEEIQREGINCTIEHHAVWERWWVKDPSIYSSWGISKKALTYFLDSVRLELGNNALSSYKGLPANNTVWIYQMNMYFFSSLAEEVTVTQTIIPYLNRVDHPAGLVILANLGHHLAAERSHHDASHMNTRISDFLGWLHGLALTNPNR
jgi:hypothetical protein